MRLLSATFDENTHLPSGYTYLQTGEIRLNPQHPPLIKLLCALPLLALRPRLNLQDPAWRSNPPDEWTFGYRFLYGNDADRLLFWGRLPVVLLSLLLAFYCSIWARRLFGDGAGLVALALCAFSPTVIAHARLVTFDVGLACFSTMSLYHLWRHATERASLHLVAGGLAMGLALASKFSGCVFLATVVPLQIWGALRREDISTALARCVRALRDVTVVLALSGLVVWASYLFSGDPLAYWKGMMRVNADRVADFHYYLMGEFRTDGWWYYFLFAFLFKTPVPVLLLLGLSVAFLRRYPARSGLAEAFLVLPALLFTGVTSALAYNLGIRYLLPVYPLVFVFVSRLSQAPRSRWSRCLAGGLALWYVAGTLAIYPDYLAYFNEIVGGPSRGHLYLDDSNIDWGQDLKRLKNYLDENGIDRVKLAYGPLAAPDYYGISWEPITPTEWAGPPPPGVYAVGTNVLLRGELWARQTGVGADWLSRYQPKARVGYSLFVFEFGSESADSPP